MEVVQKMSVIPVAMTLVLLVGTLVSFLVAYSLGHVSIYLPFISENGAQVPEQCIFSLTLIFGSFLGMAMVCCRHLFLLRIIDPSHKKLLGCSRLAHVAGLASMAGLAGVAAFPMSTILVIHLAAAGVHFGGGWLYLALQTFIGYKLPPPHRRSDAVCKFRLALIVFMGIFLGLLVVMFPYSYFKWRELHSKLPALKTPHDEGFAVVFVAAMLEWLLYGTFLAFLTSLTVDFQNFQLVLSARDAPEKPVENEIDVHVEADARPSEMVS